MRSPFKSSPDRIRKGGYDFNRRRIGPEPTRRMREVAIEEVIVEDLLLRMNKTKIFFER